MFSKITLTATAISAGAFLSVTTMASPSTAAPTADVASRTGSMLKVEAAEDLQFDLSIHEQPEFSNVRAVGFTCPCFRDANDEL